jgi:ArsR family transcriptional regulator
LVIAPTWDLPVQLRLFGDATRLRILALLEREELSVGELARALGLAQSRVSNHLRLLREAGALIERHAGPSTFVRAALASDPPLDVQLCDPRLSRLWAVLRADLAALPEHAADRRRLAHVLAERGPERDPFERLAADWDKLAGAFSTGQARGRAAAQLLPRGGVYADLGCGTGYMGAALGGCVGELILVDRSPAMLAEARRRLEPASAGTRLHYVEAALDQLPLASASLDGALAGLVLHHLERTEPALSEMHRVLKPGAALAILELAPHREEWMRRELGDRHLGLLPSDLLSALQRAGFHDLALEPVDDRYCPQSPAAAAGNAPTALELYVARARA